MTVTRSTNTAGIEVVTCDVCRDARSSGFTDEDGGWRDYHYAGEG